MGHFSLSSRVEILKGAIILFRGDYRWLCAMITLAFAGLEMQLRAWDNHVIEV
jgi:hypothetical protein